jgi:hypothetical protein
MPAIPPLWWRAPSERGDPAINPHLPVLRTCQDGDHADGCVPMVLRMRAVPHRAEAEAGRLLRLLLLWLSTLPADPATRPSKPAPLRERRGSVRTKRLIGYTTAARGPFPSRVAWQIRQARLTRAARGIRVGLSRQLVAPTRRGPIAQFPGGWRTSHFKSKAPKRLTLPTGTTGWESRSVKSRLGRRSRLHTRGLQPRSWPRFNELEFAPWAR